MSAPLLVLVGPPGSGKTTVGGLLAARLGVTFRDTDADIVAASGKSISDIFMDDGEPHFRILEYDAVRRALDEHVGVVSLGGGSVLNDRVRAALAGHRVARLTVSLSDAASRVGLGTTRPVLALNPRAMLKHLMQQREPLYAEVAGVSVDTSGRRPDDIVDELVGLIRHDAS